MPSPAAISPEVLLGMTGKFATWLEKAGYESYDPYDIWGTPYGLWARQLYYRKSIFGIPFIAPVLLSEILWPGCRSFLVKKQRFATADAQLLLAFLNLFEVTQEKIWLQKARELGQELLGYSIPGYRGYCWGYPFDWQNSHGLWPRNTPYITCTPYCYEAFVKLFELTCEARYADIARSIAQFVHDDLRDTPTGQDAAAASYSPKVNDRVVNASAYRAMVLFDASARFNMRHYEVKARGNLNFILQSQRPDGAWLYAVEDPKQKFIDHFHTCFVLKNLFKINRILNSQDLASTIIRGYRYYEKDLFDAEGNPKYYAVQPRAQIVRLEMYNVAEAITLGTILQPLLPEALSMAQSLALKVKEKYQLDHGPFITRVYLGGLKHTFPFLRWPQAQVFYGLTNLLKSISKPELN